MGSFLLAAAAAVAAGLSLLTPPGEAGHLDAAAAVSTTALTAGGAAGDEVIAVLPTVSSEASGGPAGCKVAINLLDFWICRSIESFERVEQIGLPICSCRIHCTGTCAPVPVKAAHRLYHDRISRYYNKIYRWVTTLLSYTRSRSTKNIMVHVVYDLFSSMISTSSHSTTINLSLVESFNIII